MNRKTPSKCKNTESKTAEHKRSRHINSLCTELSSLIPQDYMQYSTDNITMGDQFEVSASYMKNLNVDMEQLKAVQMQKEASTSTENRTDPSTIPMVQLSESGSLLEAHIAASMNPSTLFYRAIRILEDEGAEVVNASFSNNGDKVYLTIHAQVKFPRIAVEIETINKRLQDLIS